jgi:hypothetical protein
MKCHHFPRLLLPTFFSVLLVDRHQEIKKREHAQLVLYNVVIRASSGRQATAVIDFDDDL